MLGSLPDRKSSKVFAGGRRQRIDLDMGKRIEKMGKRKEAGPIDFC
jgi:hypothetical protein